MIHLWQHLWLWFAIHTGTYNEPGPYYGFFSGFGSDLGEVVIIGGIIHLVRTANCHVHGCYRIGKHQVEGTPYKTCKKHHPGMIDEDTTPEHIAKVYNDARINT